MRVKRESLVKQIREKKEDIKRREAEAEVLEQRLSLMDQEEAGRILKRYNLTPEQLNEILVKNAEEAKKLIEEERRLKNNGKSEKM